jgi:hypothetical protein
MRIPDGCQPGGKLYLPGTVIGLSQGNTMDIPQSAQALRMLILNQSPKLRIPKSNKKIIYYYYFL